MKCPVCSKEMQIAGKDISSNPENGRKYNRTVYCCKDCDAWANTEIPVKTENP